MAASKILRLNLVLFVQALKSTLMGVETNATIDINTPTTVTPRANLSLLRECNSLGTIIYPFVTSQNDMLSVPKVGWRYFFNQYHNSIGISIGENSGNGPYLTIYCSNDGITWTLLGSSLQDTTAIKDTPYWKIYNSFTNASLTIPFTIDYDGFNIHFSTPPAAGAVITADYITDLIAKDTNHVLDFSVIFTFGEYTP